MARKAKSMADSNGSGAAGAVVVSQPSEVVTVQAAGFWGQLASLGAAIEQGRSRLDELDGALERFAASRLTISELGKRLDELRTDAGKRVNALRAEVVRRVDESPGVVVAQTIGFVRPRLRSLSSELHAVARRLEGGEPQKRSAGRPAA